MVWHNYTLQMAAHSKGTQLIPCPTGLPRPSKLSDPQFLPMEFPLFGHCRGINFAGVSTCNQTCAVGHDFPEANHLLKYVPEAGPTLNSYAKMCTQDAQEYYFLLADN